MGDSSSARCRCAPTAFTAPCRVPSLPSLPSLPTLCPEILTEARCGGGIVVEVCHGEYLSESFWLKTLQKNVVFDRHFLSNVSVTSMGAAASAFECLLPIASFCLLAAYHYRFSKDSSERSVPLTFTSHGLMSRQRAVQHCIQVSDKICLIQAYRCHSP